MAYQALSTTTLPANITASQTTFAVAASTGMAVGMYLIIQNEMMVLTAIPTAGFVTVQRGVNGSAAFPHQQYQRVVFGTANPGLGSTNDDGVPLTGQPGQVLQPGTRARDAAGNEYVLCDATATIYGRQPVSIGGDFTCTTVSTSGRGAVGVACEPGTSDQCLWVQVYGRAMMQIGMGGVSPSDAANGPTTLSTSAQTRFLLATSLSVPAALGWSSDASTSGYQVLGMYVATDASPGDVSAVTGATSATGGQIAVWLNYPMIRYQPGTTAP